MITCLTSFILVMLQISSVYAQTVSNPAGTTELFPKNNSVNINPDTRLKITFPSAPPLGNKGKIRVYDASNDELVDELDLSIPPGPKNTRTPSPYDKIIYSSIPDTIYTVNAPDTDTTHVYQKNYIGGTTEGDAYHFFPVLFDENVATIYLHNHRLEYNKTYYVQIDSEVFPFSDGSFPGITGKTDWIFGTKNAPPSADSKRLVVSSDGTGDFDTVQGAIDSIPYNNPDPKTIFIKNGIYEEIIYFRNKAKFTLLGEDREKVVIRYANNGVFNYKLVSGGHNTRAVFAEQNSTDINLINFTIQSVGEEENPAQAEALYVNGDRYQVHNVTMMGSGDALQATGKIFLSQSSLRGYGDNVLSYGAVFFKNCELISTYGPHVWPRNPNTNHGDVFLNCTFSLVGGGTKGDGTADIARSPTSGVDFPYAEVVLINCKLAGVRPEGWGPVGPDTSNVHFWEYNSVNLSDGKPVDVSQRVAWSRQLTMEKDSQTISDYSNPAYVLGGWAPELAPVILTQLPDTINVLPGKDTELKISVAAVPDATYQWFKDGKLLDGKTNSNLKLESVSTADSGEYSVSINNSVGTITSNKANVIVGDAGAQAGTAGGDAQTGAAGAGAQAGTAGGNASSSPMADSGTAVPYAGAPGSGAESAGTSGAASGNAAPSSGGSCGCRISPERRTSGGAWPALLAAFLIVVRTRRRRSADNQALLRSSRNGPTVLVPRDFRNP